MSALHSYSVSVTVTVRAASCKAAILAIMPSVARTLGPQEWRASGAGAWRTASVPKDYGQTLWSDASHEDEDGEDED